MALSWLLVSQGFRWGIFSQQFTTWIGLIVAWMEVLSDPSFPRRQDISQTQWLRKSTNVNRSKIIWSSIRFFHGNCRELFQTNYWRIVWAEVSHNRICLRHLKTFYLQIASGERLSHAVGCAFALCLERKLKRDKDCEVSGLQYASVSWAATLP